MINQTTSGSLELSGHKCGAISLSDFQKKNSKKNFLIVEPNARSPTPPSLPLLPPSQCPLPRIGTRQLSSPWI